MRVTGAAAVLFFLIACNSAAPQTQPMDASALGADVVAPGTDALADVGASPDVDAVAPLDAGDGAFPGPAVREASAWVGLDATTLDAAGPDPAARACGTDAGDDGGLCPLPYSRCADRRWLVYYDNGNCVSGQCAWDKKYLDCGNIGCFVGACQYPITAQAAP